MMTVNEEQLIKEITDRVVETIRSKSACSISPVQQTADSLVIPVGISVRHVHVNQRDLEALYGAGHELTKLRDLVQPGEFAARETVALIGPKMRAIERVRILGPTRERTQVEVARTDAIFLGIDPPVAKSGQLDGAEPITLVGPAGSLRLESAAIVANRHIHMSPSDAERLGVKDDEEVSVSVSGPKSLVFNKVQCRVSEKFVLQMHLDTDDANAAGIVCGATAELVR